MKTYYYKTNYSLWKSTKTIKPPVEFETHLRKPSGSWARSAEENATLFANYLSEVCKPKPSKNEFSPPVIPEILDYADCVAMTQITPEIKNMLKMLLIFF